MRRLLLFLSVIFSIFLFFDLLVWLLAQASGHNIPIKTDWSFGIMGCIFLGLLILSIYLAGKSAKRREENDIEEERFP
jgi:hypothetical protein